MKYGEQFQVLSIASRLLVARKNWRRTGHRSGSAGSGVLPAWRAILFNLADRSLLDFFEHLEHALDVHGVIPEDQHAGAIDAKDAVGKLGEGCRA